MLNYSSLPSAIKDFLTQKFTIPVEEGKYGEMPSVVPCIWIYIEPARNAATAANHYPVARRAKITFFAMESAIDNKTEAANKSVELIEQVESFIFSQEFSDYINTHTNNVNQNFTTIKYTDSDQPLNFDAIYSDMAVSFLEIWIDYAKATP
ncbi:MAG: hypothetical protein B6D44_15175 [Ignavibacteriales bacterium UTCHB2]|jgi:hypothetical protein|nr:MAG: hypothetical protein B6D44_15175 [Ignavibacteriales bacterium UTCHB2]